MYKIPLDTATVERIIEERFDNDEAAFLRRAGLHKTTLTRWLSGEHQPQAERFLALCGTLGVDFFVLLDLSSEARVQELSCAVAQAVLGGGWKNSVPSLSFLGQFLLGFGDWPGENWLVYYNVDGTVWLDEGGVPSRAASLLKSELFQRQTAAVESAWCVWDYVHDPSISASDCYGTISLTPSIDSQVWWFAFKESWGIPWMWFRYGCVRKRWEEVLLQNFVFMGEVERIHPGPGSSPVLVQTHLPPRRITFRVASLHSFDAKFMYAEPPAGKFVRFRQTGPS